jgi:uncharacterized protein YifN (PemK superfamily)
MPIKFAPYAGQVLRCDFQGNIIPEMVKHRPVVVLTPRTISEKTFTVTVVPLSTTGPKTIEPYHIPIELHDPLPEKYERKCWAKCDMLYTVSFKRLELIRLGKDRTGKRLYYTQPIEDYWLEHIRNAALHTLGK